MAWAVKYQAEFEDVNGVAWILYFDEDAWAGAITSLTPGANPLNLTWNQGDKYQPIIGSMADIQLKYESAIDTLCTEDSQEIRFSAYRAGTLFWQGFLAPGQYHRQFNKPVHFVTLTASDGLGELKDIKFEDESRDPYYYSETEAVIIANILLKTGITTTFYDAINIYEANHDSTVAHSPLNQTYIWPEQYWDELTDERGDCYTVLSDILKKYGATIRYSYGHWYLLRPNDYSLHEDIYYRVFTSAGVYSSNDSYTANYTIGDSSSSMFYINADQEITRLPGAGNSEIQLTPRIRQNALKNGAFNDFTWTGVNPDYWSHSSTVPTYNNTRDSDVITIYTNEASAQPTYYLKSQVNLNDCKSVRLTVNYRCYYQLSPTYVRMCIGIVVGTGQYYEPSTDTWSSTSYAGGTSPVVYDFIAESKASMTTYETIVIEPTEGPYGAWGTETTNNYITIRLYELWNETSPGGVNNWIAYDSVFLELEKDGSLPETYIFPFDGTNSINNIRTDEIKLGDTFLTARDDIFYGITTLNQNILPTATAEWFIKGHNTTVTNEEPIGELLARQLTEGYSKSLDLFRGSIRSDYFFVPHMAFEDSNFKDAYGFNKRFFPKGINYDVRNNVYGGEWIECPPVYSDTGFEWASHDCGGDATITGNSIEIDSWTSAGAGDFAYFDEYTAVAGETVRAVLTLTDDGSSYLPRFYVDGVSQTRAWGTNYYTLNFAAAGAKTFELNDPIGSETFNCTAVLTIYGITGI